MKQRPESDFWEWMAAEGRDAGNIVTVFEGLRAYYHPRAVGLDRDGYFYFPNRHSDAIVTARNAPGIAAA